MASALFGLLRRLPLPLAGRLSRMATRTLDRAMPKLRRIATVNLSFAFPEASPERKQFIIDGIFRNIARLILAMARFPSLNQDNISTLVGYQGLENYEAAKRAGKGLLIATAHLGNWELSAFAHALLTEPMHVMVRPLDNPLIDELVESRRASSGNHLISKRDAARAVIKALRANEPVGVLIDQNTSAAEGVFINFFGKPACASSAFVKLAHHSGAAVIPGFALWHEGEERYVIHFRPAITMTGDVAFDTQQIHTVLEGVIREHPDQWLWIHRRWKTRPPGEPPIY